MRAIVAASVIAAVLAVGAPDNGLGEDYTWVAWDDATAMAAAVQKPIMLVITKPWCGACKALKPAFASSKDLLSMSANFVMVNIVDNEPSGSSPDGGYIPRILFADAAGNFATDIINEAGNPRYKYFYGAPDGIVASMKKALEKLGSAAGSSGSKQDL